MLPSLLAREIQNGLKHFLTTGFEPSDPLFAGVMQRFTDDEGRWLKGPYVQIGLPFRTGTRGKRFSGAFETEFPVTFIRKRRGNGWRVSRAAAGTLGRHRHRQRQDRVFSVPAARSLRACQR
jgi:DEAD/DEAH box helicase domain-containing protein